MNRSQCRRWVSLVAIVASVGIGAGALATMGSASSGAGRQSPIVLDDSTSNVGNSSGGGLGGGDVTVPTDPSTTLPTDPSTTTPTTPDTTTPTTTAPTDSTTVPSTTNSTTPTTTLPTTTTPLTTQGSSTTTSPPSTVIVSPASHATKPPAVHHTAPHEHKPHETAPHSKKPHTTAPHNTAPHEHVPHTVHAPDVTQQAAKALAAFTRVFAERPHASAAKGVDEATPLADLSVQAPPKDYLSGILVIAAVALIAVGYLFFVARLRSRRRARARQRERAAAAVAATDKAEP